MYPVTLRGASTALDNKSVVIPERDRRERIMKANLRSHVAQLEVVRIEIREAITALWGEGVRNGGDEDRDRWLREQVAEVQREAAVLGSKELTLLERDVRAAEMNADAIMDLLIAL
jgi:hypothetical protein